MQKGKTPPGKWSLYWGLMKKSFKRLKQNDPLRMAGATAFFTSFALPPIIVLLFQLFSLFFARKTIGQELGEVLSATLGRQGADQMRMTARGLRNLAQTWYMATIGVLFLAFVATTLFNVIRNTINDIWNIRLQKSEFLYDIKVRGRSLVIILAAGMLFLAESVIDVIKIFAGNYIAKYWAEGGRYFTSVLNEVTSILIVTTWFMVLFRYLANGRPSWRVTRAGGIVTGVLFYLGRSLLATMINNSNAGAVYGAGAAIVLILLFVFYSSFILYFGASFIKEYSMLTGDPIVPSRRAYLFELQKVPGERQ